MTRWGEIDSGVPGEPPVAPHPAGFTRGKAAEGAREPRQPRPPPVRGGASPDARACRRLLAQHDDCPMDERAGGVLPLSLIVLARNEEAAIGRCLDSVPFAAEKIVIDSGSTDGTAAVAAAHGATVIDREWLGFGPTRRRAEEDAAHEWILMLDADEWMSDELQRQCRDELPGLLERTDALQLSRRTRYCGRTMNHYRPFARDHIWRCYRRGRAAWTPDQVHERLQPAPGCRTHRLTAPLVHDSYASVAHHQEKACRYVDLWARQAFERGRKPRLLGTFLSLPAYLIRDLVLRRGVLDGWPGVIAAWITVHSTVMKRLRLYELYRDAGSRRGGTGPLSGGMPGRDADPSAGASQAGRS